MNANDNEQVQTPATESAPATKPAKAKKAPAKKAPAKKAKTAVKKSAAKAEKKGKKAKVKTGEGVPKGPAALKEYAPKYTKDSEHKTVSGNVSVHCGDAVAKKFLGKSLDEIYPIVAKATEENEKDLRKKYAHLNVGMQRMNLGNKLRGVLNAK
jgi:hypothetical protein